MTLTIFALVLFAALFHATWNAFAKGSKNEPLLTMSLFAICSGLVTLPLIPFVGLPNQAAYGYLLTSGFIHIAYYILVALCYKHGAFSAVYPIFRGSAPLLTLFITAVFALELPRLNQVLGIVILTIGLILLGSNAFKKGGLNSKALFYALMLACVVATYTVLDGLGARASHNAFSYVLFTHLINGVFMGITSVFILKVNFKQADLKLYKISVLSGVFSLISYGIVLYAMTKAEISLVSAVRETSVLFATLIGWWFLKEKLGKIHIFAAVIIVAGLALIKL